MKTATSMLSRLSLLFPCHFQDTTGAFSKALCVGKAKGRKP